MKQLIVISLLWTFSACSKNEEQTNKFVSCEEQTKNFKRYDGEEIGCKLHFRLTEFESQNYIELNAHCADLTRPVVINESCIDICEISPHDLNSQCARYLSKRKVIEVLLIEK